MKILIVASLISFSALAEVPTFWPKQSTCAEIQSAMAQYGSVGINVKYLFGMETFIVSQEKPECDSFHWVSKMKKRTSDGIKCTIGYYCEEMVDNN